MAALIELLRIEPGAIVSLVGAGGKTTTMYRLCHEAADRGWTVVSTTTTAIQQPTARQSARVLVEADLPDLAATLRAALAQDRHVTLAGSWLRPDKLRGVSEATVQAVSRTADVVVIEADGARHHAIKAPADHEPVVPSATTHFLSVAGLHALSQPLGLVCHRPEVAAGLTGQALTEPVTEDALAALLASPSGGLRGRPVGSLAWVILTHLTGDNTSSARQIALRLGDAGYDGVIGLSPEEAIDLG
ncbi:MAG: selenium cofactor biosynthesis protein YqeC [Chloroflexota bacterium]|nr:selenium cofactor biosynthesis protein YqeC [Chloroflexota bacterium]